MKPIVKKQNTVPLRETAINDMELSHVNVGHFGGVCNKKVL